MARVSIKFKVAELLYFCVLYILFQQTYAKKDSFILTVRLSVRLTVTLTVKLTFTFKSSSTNNRVATVTE